MNADWLRVRRATRSDLPAILRVEQRAANASHWSEEEYERILSSELLLVAETGGTIAGFLSAKQAAGEWELENIAVAPDFQRRGIAVELIRSLIEEARQGGACTVHLEVRESNLPARRFYEKHGFDKVGRRRGYYSSPEEDAILYRLDLNSSGASESPEPRA
jgi:[ribosomal protein S18]-alanine N-acetyltransferase